MDGSLRPAGRCPEGCDRGLSPSIERARPDAWVRSTTASPRFWWVSTKGPVPPREAAGRVRYVCPVCRRRLREVAVRLPMVGS
jgi:hypothetical protein